MAGTIVATDLGSRDQLFSQLTSRVACVDPATGAFSSHDTGIIVGGTGKFAGATGSFVNDYTGSFLVFDPDLASNQGFGNFIGTFSGTLTLP